MSGFNFNLSYPYSDEYEYVTRLIRLNLDEERKKSIIDGKGFIISRPQSIKKDIKDENSIFSSKFGQTLQDMNPFADKYKCACGHTTSRINHDTICPICGEKVEYVDDDFGIFGWIVLKDPYYIIHPNLYKTIEYLIGATRFDNILKFVDEKDEDGHSREIIRPKNEPFLGLGILGFKENFDEVIEYYYKKNPNKKDYYLDIMREKEKVFIQSVPVYTTHLRPFRMDGTQFHFEGTNAKYNMLSKFAYCINNDTLKILREKKPKYELLYDMNAKYLSLYKEIENILSGKKGTLRSVFGGRSIWAA